MDKSLGRLHIVREVIWRGGAALVALILSQAVLLFLLVRDNVLSLSVRNNLQLSKIPALSFWQWATFAMLVFTLFVFEGAFQLIRRERTALSKTQSDRDAILLQLNQTPLHPAHEQKLGETIALLLEDQTPDPVEHRLLRGYLREHIPDHEIWAALEAYDTIHQEMRDATKGAITRILDTVKQTGWQAERRWASKTQDQCVRAYHAPPQITWPPPEGEWVTPGIADQVLLNGFQFKRLYPASDWPSELAKLKEAITGMYAAMPQWPEIEFQIQNLDKQSSTHDVAWVHQKELNLMVLTGTKRCHLCGAATPN